MFCVQSATISIDEFIAPFSQKISRDVAGNMSLALSGNRTRYLGIHMRYINNIQKRFDSQVSTILKIHLKKYMRVSKSLQSARKAALLAMVDLQKTIIKNTIEEYDVNLALVKKDIVKTVQMIENIILQIYKWKNDHPDAIQELIKVEQSLYNFVKPGQDGSFDTSQLVLKVKELNQAGIAKYWLYLAVYGAGSISMIVIFGIFEWITLQETS